MSIPLSYANVAFSSSGANTVIAAVVGRKYSIWRLHLTPISQQALTLRDGSTDIYGPVGFDLAGNLRLELTNIPWFQLTQGNAFIISNGAAAAVGGGVWYSSDG